MTRRQIHLAAELGGFGSHPAAWRAVGVPPGEMFAPERLLSMVRLAEQGLLDFVTLDDQSLRTPAPGCLHGALDAWLVLAQAACHTTHLGLFATGVAQGDPAVMAARTATFDRITAGRGGWRPRVAISDEERRRATADPDGHAAFTEERFADAEEFVGAVVEFWRSWHEDDLAAPHRVEWTGRGVKTSGYARVPTAASGEPLTAMLAHFSTPYRLAARYADIVFVTPSDRAGGTAIRRELERWCASLGRGPRPLTVLADLDVVLAPSVSEARDRRSALDELVPTESDAASFTGTPGELAEMLEDWHRDGGVDGFRLRPAVLSRDLPHVTGDLVPILQSRGLFKTGYGRSFRSRIRSGEG